MSRVIAKGADLRDTLRLDVATFALDMVGIVDPTGVADVTSGAISLWRGDWLSAGISFLGVFAGIGDLAKIGKLPKYTKSIEKAIELARRDPGFAKEIAPHLKELKGVIGRLPMDKLPPDVKPFVQRIRYQLDNYIKEVPVTKQAQLAKGGKEIVERSKSIEEARNKAIKWLESKGATFGPHTKPIPGKLHQKHTGKEIGVGVASTKGPAWEIRIDFDPSKGPHYNVMYRAEGAAKSSVEKAAFTFPTPAGVKPEAWAKKLMDSLGDVKKRPLPKAK